MDTGLAFMMGELNRDQEPMVFDWDKAARIIREKKPQEAYAGLDNDLEYTGGFIFDNGEIVTDDYTFLASTWATPLLFLDGSEGIPCYLMEHETDWDAKTKWPESAIKILRGE